MILKRLSIKKKFLVLFSVVFLILVIGGIINYAKITTSKQTWNNYLEQVAKRQQYLMEIKEAFGYGGGIHNFKNFIP